MNVATVYRWQVRYYIVDAGIRRLFAETTAAPTAHQAVLRATRRHAHELLFPDRTASMWVVLKVEPIGAPQ